MNKGNFFFLCHWLEFFKQLPFTCVKFKICDVQLITKCLQVTWACTVHHLTSDLCNLICVKLWTNTKVFSISHYFFEHIIFGVFLILSHIYSSIFTYFAYVLSPKWFAGLIMCSSCDVRWWTFFLLASLNLTMLGFFLQCSIFYVCHLM